MAQEICARRGKFFGGCRFEARYDRGPARELSENEYLIGDSDTVVDMLNAVRAETYVRDVCATCGKTVEREDRP